MEFVPVQLAYEEHGQGLPVIFVHGYPFDRTIWKSMIPLLQDEIRLIVPDLRGFGQSPYTDGVYSMRLMAEDLVTLLDKLKIEQAVLVGHSMGGYIGLSFAQAYPSRLAGLVLVTTQAAADSAEKRQGRYRTAEEVGRKGLKNMMEGMPPRLTQHESLRPVLSKLIGAANPKAVIAALKGMAERPDATDWLANMEMPAVVVAGAEDVLIPLENCQTMAQILPRGWLVELAGCGHMPMLEDPAALAKVVMDLVRVVKTTGKTA